MYDSDKISTAETLNGVEDGGNYFYHLLTPPVERNTHFTECAPRVPPVTWEGRQGSVLHKSIAMTKSLNKVPAGNWSSISGNANLKLRSMFR